MRLVFVLIWVAILVIALAAMWWGWRARTRRDAGVIGATEAPVGELIAEFGTDAASGTGRVMYVSTTPEGEPLSRVAAPGLRYRGPAEIAVRDDGVTIQVAGESPVHLAATQLTGSGTASRRVGKAVESDGLAILNWRDGDRELESSFRFSDRTAQQRFTDAINGITTDSGAAHTEATDQIPPSPQTPQEDAQ